MITFICAGCNQLSDDGDIPARLCMDCADKTPIARIYDDEDGAGSERYYLPELANATDYRVKLYNSVGRLILNEIVRTETMAEALGVVEALCCTTGTEYSKVEITKSEPNA